MKHKGLRNNDGKPRLSLIPSYPRLVLGKILTKGAQKYDDRNWEKGMAWSDATDSLERHLNKFKAGEDFDDETDELHIAHVMANAMFLTQYYKTYPQGDDRPHEYLTQPKIGLDIDEVICDWVGGFAEKFDYDLPFHHWDFSYDIQEHLSGLDLEKFYLGLQPLIDPHSIPFDPHCYITSRPVDTIITQQWLSDNGFPTKKVHTVKMGESKVQKAKKSGIDIFVDDSLDNFNQLNANGICTFLWDRPHNRKYDVGYKRINNLNQIFNPEKLR